MQHTDASSVSLEVLMALGRAALSSTECPITLSTLSEPVTTKCGHTFEKEHIVNIIKDNQKKGKESECPLCRNKITLKTLRQDLIVKSFTSIIFDDHREQFIAAIKKQDTEKMQEIKDSSSTDLINIKLSSNKTALEIAVDENAPTSFVYLIRTGAIPTEELIRKLVASRNYGFLQLLPGLSQDERKYANFNKMYEVGLLHACLLVDPRAAHIFLERGTMPSQVHHQYKYDLSIAVEENNLALTDLLLHYGASPNARATDQSHTALLNACSPDVSYEVFCLILGHTATDPNISVAYATPLEFAASNDQVEKVAAILAHKNLSSFSTSGKISDNSSYLINLAVFINLVFYKNNDNAINRMIKFPLVQNSLNQLLFNNLSASEKYPAEFLFIIKQILNLSCDFSKNKTFSESFIIGALNFEIKFEIFNFLFLLIHRFDGEMRDSWLGEIRDFATVALKEKLDSLENSEEKMKLLNTMHEKEVFKLHRGILSFGATKAQKEISVLKKALR